MHFQDKNKLNSARIIFGDVANGLQKLIDGCHVRSRYISGIGKHPGKSFVSTSKLLKEIYPEIKEDIRFRSAPLSCLAEQIGPIFKEKIKELEISFSPDYLNNLYKTLNKKKSYLSEEQLEQVRDLFRSLSVYLSQFKPSSED